MPLVNRSLAKAEVVGQANTGPLRPLVPKGCRGRSRDAFACDRLAKMRRKFHLMFAMWIDAGIQPERSGSLVIAASVLRRGTSL